MDIHDEIEQFKKTGRLSRDHDVLQKRPNGGGYYWTYVGNRLNGKEPILNSGEIRYRDIRGSTDKGAKFKQWLDLEFPKLAQFDRELFTLAWEQKLPVSEIGKLFNLSTRVVYKRLEMIKSSIAAYVGIEE